MKDFLDAAPKIIGVMSFAVLFMTVVHEWGYFYVLGWHLQTLATTYDYLTNAFVWLPTTAGILTGAQLLEQTMVVESDKVRLNRITLIMVSVVPVLGVFGYLFFGGESPAPFVTSLLGIGAAFYLVKIIPGKWLASDWKHRFVVVAPLVPLLMLGYGISSGYSDLRKTSDVYAINQKEQQGTRQLVLLRTFEKGILVRDVPARRIEFIRWENVTSLSRLLASEKTVGYLCLWFDIACRGNDPNPVIP